MADDGWAEEWCAAMGELPVELREEGGEGTGHCSEITEIL